MQSVFGCPPLSPQGWFWDLPPRKAVSRQIKTAAPARAKSASPEEKPHTAAPPEIKPLSGNQSVGGPDTPTHGDVHAAMKIDADEAKPAHEGDEEAEEEEKKAKTRSIPRCPTMPMRLSLPI